MLLRHAQTQTGKHSKIDTGRQAKTARQTGTGRHRETREQATTDINKKIQTDRQTQTD